MKLKTHLDKNNLHHAYLIEGKKEEIIPEVLDFLKSIGVNLQGNLDFNQITLDSFKIDDARNLKSQSIEKAISSNLSTGQVGKKVFLISTNNFLIEAQNTLLKMFEEPIEDTIFFLIVPDTAIILPTLLSRFYLIKTKNDLTDELKEAEEFLTMSLNNRILFMKKLVAKPEEEEYFEIISQPSQLDGESSRSKAINFLNLLEKVLHQRLISKISLDKEVDYFYQILKTREYLSQPGSSIKNLMEGIALAIPLDSR